MSEKSEPQPQPDQEPSPIGEISQEPSAFEAFLDANQKKLIIAGISLIIALVAYVVIDGLKQQRKENDSAEVSAARTVPELEAQATEKAGTNAGGTALLYKARLQWQDLQQTEAIKTLETFIENHSGHPAYASSLASIASYHHEMGDLEQAKSYYLKAVDENAAASSYALITLGDIARNEGENEAAKSYYDRASEEFGGRHALIRDLSERHAKLLGVAAPTEVKPAPPAPKLTTPGVSSNPVKVDPLPGAPDLPEKTVIDPPKLPTEPVPADPPKLPTEPVPADPIPAKPDAPSDPLSK